MARGNHFDQYEEGHLEIEQASLDKPIESVRPPPICIIPPELGRARMVLDVNAVKSDSRGTLLAIRECRWSRRQR
ncbi:hypothetical protein Nmel_018306 [Mimus melanotis]